MTNLIAAWPKLIFVLALLGATAYLTVAGVMTGNDALGFLSLVIGATAVAGTIVLSGPTPNTDLYPHAAILMAIIAFTTVMGSKHIFTGTEIVGVLGVLLGGGTVAIGSVNPTPTQQVALTAKRAIPVPTPGHAIRTTAPLPVPDAPPI